MGPAHSRPNSEPMCPTHLERAAVGIDEQAVQRRRVEPLPSPDRFGSMLPDAPGRPRALSPAVMPGVERSGGLLPSVEGLERVYQALVLLGVEVLASQLQPKRSREPTRAYSPASQDRAVRDRRDPRRTPRSTAPSRASTSADSCCPNRSGRPRRRSRRPSRVRRSACLARSRGRRRRRGHRPRSRTRSRVRSCPNRCGGPLTGPSRSGRRGTTTITRSSGLLRKASASALPTSRDQKYWSSIYSSDRARRNAF